MRERKERQNERKWEEGKGVEGKTGKGREREEQRATHKHTKLNITTHRPLCVKKKKRSIILPFLSSSISDSLITFSSVFLFTPISDSPLQFLSVLPFPLFLLIQRILCTVFILYFILTFFPPRSGKRSLCTVAARSDCHFPRLLRSCGGIWQLTSSCPRAVAFNIISNIIFKHLFVFLVPFQSIYF